MSGQNRSSPVTGNHLSSVVLSWVQSEGFISPDGHRGGDFAVIKIKKLPNNIEIEIY